MPEYSSSNNATEPEKHVIKPRELECEGIYGKETARKFSHQDRTLFFLRAPLILKFIRKGITSGRVLEAGCGTGILGLNLLRFTRKDAVSLFEVDVSGDMVAIARKNAGRYGVTRNARFVRATLQDLPFPDNYFDGIISNGSLHHWTNPRGVFSELSRVLKPDGRVVINDLRRNASRVLSSLLKMVLTKWQRKQFDKSFNAAYTVRECREILTSCSLKGWRIRPSILEFEILGTLSR